MSSVRTKSYNKVYTPSTAWNIAVHVAGMVYPAMVPVS